MPIREFPFLNEGVMSARNQLTIATAPAAQRTEQVLIFTLALSKSPVSLGAK